MKQNFQWTPARLTSASFLSLIFIGTVLLSLPASTLLDKPANFIDAFFTAVSAVCVTGLTVKDTSTFFSPFGQGVILFLIQIGGLGIMTLSASLPILFGKQIKLSKRDLFQGILDEDDYLNLRSTLRNIIIYTLIIEGIGATILSIRFYTLWGDWSQSIYYGVFHAISAFCNAGFALFNDSLSSFMGDPIVNITVMTLIVSGGLGFIVLKEIFNKKRWLDFSFHSKLVLTTTAILISLSATIMFFAEFSNAFLRFDFFEKFFASFFHVISARTAGFNTIDITSLTNASIFGLCILMFIGGAPGGSAGGIKVTTISILFLSIRSILSGREQIEIFGKRVTPGQLTKITAIIAVSFFMVTVLMITLMIFEEAPFKQVFFETISAFGTTGLSLGLTPNLSEIGKIIICLAMFLGRIGPLSLVFLIGTRSEKIYYRYPKGKIMLG